MTRINRGYLSLYRAWVVRTWGSFFLPNLHTWIAPDFDDPKKPAKYLWLKSRPHGHLDQLVGGFQPLVDMGNDFVRTFKSYKSARSLLIDFLQPFFGLLNIGKGLLNLIFFIPMFMVETFDTLINIFPPHKEGRWAYFKGRMTKNFINSISWAIEGVANIIRGVTQLIATPLTWLIKMPLRSIISVLKKRPKIKQGKRIRELVTLAENHLYLQHADNENYKKSYANILKELHRKYIKKLTREQETTIQPDEENIKFVKSEKAFIEKQKADYQKSMSKILDEQVDTRKGISRCLWYLQEDELKHPYLQNKSDANKKDYVHTLIELLNKYIDKLESLPPITPKNTEKLSEIVEQKNNSKLEDEAEKENTISIETMKSIEETKNNFRAFHKQLLNDQENSQPYWNSVIELYRLYYHEIKRIQTILSQHYVANENIDDQAFEDYINSQKITTTSDLVDEKFKKLYIANLRLLSTYFKDIFPETTAVEKPNQQNKTLAYKNIRIFENAQRYLQLFSSVKPTHKKNKQAIDFDDYDEDIDDGEDGSKEPDYITKLFSESAINSSNSTTHGS